MAIYADKTAGKLNGRWRVELQRGNERHRKRFDSHADVVKDEKDMLALWEAGGNVPVEPRVIKAPTVHTILSLSDEAQGTLWAGAPGEDTSWAHIRRIGKSSGTRLWTPSTLSWWTSSSGT